VLHISAVLPASRERRLDQNWIGLDCHKRFCQRVGSFVKLKTIIHHYTKLWRSSCFSLIPYSAKVFHTRLISLESIQCYHLDSFVCMHACNSGLWNPILNLVHVFWLLYAHKIDTLRLLLLDIFFAVLFFLSCLLAVCTHEYLCSLSLHNCF
jgi:hypothetical protein